MSVSSDRGAEVTEGICHGLHPPSILSGEICLDKLAESGVQVENLDLVVVEELGLDSNPGLASAPPLADVVLHLDLESAEDPGQDNTVHPGPGVRRHHRVGEGVAVEGQ